MSGCANNMSQENDLKPYPPADPGMLRSVIRLPVAETESNLQVELSIGRELEVDCNQHWFGGRFERQVVAGWGYSMYRLSEVSGPASTLMACPPGEEKRTVFVTVRLDDPLVRYNSKLPIVVYVPDGFRVRYRIWSASDEYSNADLE